jgi:hypothetical protein
VTTQTSVVPAVRMPPQRARRGPQKTGELVQVGDLVDNERQLDTGLGGRVAFFCMLESV